MVHVDYAIIIVNFKDMQGFFVDCSIRKWYASMSYYSQLYNLRNRVSAVYYYQCT